MSSVKFNFDLVGTFMSHMHHKIRADLLIKNKFRADPDAFNEWMQPIRF
jgi:hypothetical protein